MEPREYILNEMQKEYSFKDGVDVNSVNYIAEGYMDSIGIVQFIVELEGEYGIRFTDEELSDPNFKVVGKLIEMVEKKIAAFI